MVFDPGPRLSQQGTPLFSSFSVDLRNGTINMIGHAGGVTVQHYIDDGRKLADVPGVNVSAVQNPYGAVLGNPYSPAVGAGGIGRPANGPPPIPRP